MMGSTAMTMFLSLKYHGVKKKSASTPRKATNCEPVYFEGNSQ